MHPYVLTSDVGSLEGIDTRVVEVPARPFSKSSLLSWYAEALPLPEYFGENWDAFDECLRDLSWIKERRVVLYHRVVPLEENPKDRKIYLDLLADAVQDWKPGEAHEVVVAFDPSCEPQLLAALQ